MNWTAPESKPDFSGELNRIQRCKPATREQRLAEFSPVGHYKQDRTHKQNNNFRVCDAVEAGKVIAAVENLEEPFRSWAKWAYGPRTQDFLSEQANLFAWLDQDVTDQLVNSNREYRDTSKQRIRDVVGYTILDYRSHSINGRHLYPASLIIQKCRIQRQNWKRDFAPWQSYYWNLCDEFLDGTALPVVAAVIARSHENSVDWRNC